MGKQTADADRKKMKGRGQTTRIAICVGAAFIHAALAHAHDAPARFELRIKGGKLERVMEEMRDQTNVEFLYSFELVGTDGIKPIRGEYTLDDALRIMFEGTELSGGLTKSGMIVITRTANADAQVRESTNMTSKTKKRSLLASIALLLNGGLQSPAFAQTPPLSERPSVASKEMEEVVVTARKRTETVNDIPMSLSVVSGQSIERSGAQDFTDLLGAVPSLSAVQQGAGRTVIIMRGVSTGGIRVDKPQNKEVVGLYIDDIPVAVNGYNPESVLFDLNRVEVLRGPQGTLYGAGSMNGTIRLVTNKPDLSRVEVKVEGDTSFIEDGGTNYGLKGMFNAPLIEDTLALRLSATHLDDAGYIDNTRTGKNDVNHSEQSGFRAATRWNVNDRITVDGAFVYEDSNTDEDPFEYFTPFATNRDGSQKGARTIDQFASGGFDSEMKLYNLTTTFDLGFAELVSSSSYMDRQTLRRQTMEFVADFFAGEATSTPAEKQALVAQLNLADSKFFDTTDITDFSQEIRLTSSSAGKLQWIVGGFYNKNDRYFVQDVRMVGFDAFIAPRLGLGDSRSFGAPAIDDTFWGDQDISQEQFAVFGEMYYSLGPVTLTGGLRWFDWEQEFRAYSSGFLNGGVTSVPMNGVGINKASASGVNPKVNLSVDLTDDVMIYAQAAKGFRFGGVNDPVPTVGCENALASLGLSEAPGTFEEDTNWNYEIGLKGSAFDHRLSGNVTAFYVVWDEIQSTRSLNGLGGDNCPFSYTDNAGKLVSTGIEFETSIRLTDSFKLTAGGAFTSSELANDAPNFNARDGARAPYVPDLSLNVSGEYNFAISQSIDGYLWGGVQHTADRDNSFDKAAASFRRFDAYQLVNTRAGLRRNNTELSLYVSNLFDDQAAIFVQSPSFFGPGYTVNLRPRTIGLTLRQTF